MYKKISLIILVLLIAFLSACNNKIVEEAENIQSASENDEKKKKENKEKQIKVLEDKESSFDEIVEEINLEREEKKTIGVQEVETKEEFSTKEEFAQYVAKVLYDFHTKEITAEEYYNFFLNYGSHLLLKDIDPDKKNVIVEGYASVQNRLNEKEVKYQGYSISEITLDEPGIYGYFYRTVFRDDKELNYITTIVKEGNAWKFDSDNLSAGYNEREGESE